MARWYEQSNRELMAEFGINDTYPWGQIQSIHPFGNIAIIEAVWDRKDGRVFTAYVDGKSSGHSSDSLDGAMLIALGYKDDGANSQFFHYAGRMLGMSEAE